MQNQSSRNNPFVVFSLFVFCGIAVSQLGNMSGRTTVFCVFLFIFAGFVALLCDVKESNFKGWQRPIDTVLSMERPTVGIVSHQDDIIFSNLKSSVWYGHATNRANRFIHIKDGEHDRLVVAYKGDEPIGVFIDDDNNWLVFGPGEIV